MSFEKPTHFFSFNCFQAIIDGETKLTFSLSGNNANYYQLSNTEVSISPIGELQKTSKPPTIYFSSDYKYMLPLSNKGNFSCPSIGRFFLHQTVQGKPTFDENTAEKDTFDYLRSITGFKNTCKETKSDDDCVPGLDDYYLQGSVNSSDMISFDIQTKPNEVYNFKLVCIDTEGKKSSTSATYQSPDNDAEVFVFKMQFRKFVRESSAKREIDNLLCFLVGLLPSRIEALSDGEGQKCGYKQKFTPIPAPYVAPVEEEDKDVVVFGAGIGGPKNDSDSNSTDANATENNGTAKEGEGKAAPEEPKHGGRFL